MNFKLILFFFVFSKFAFGQNKNIDSLKFLIKETKAIEKKVDLELKLATEYIKIRELGEASEISNNALLKAIKIDNPPMIADAYLNLANIHYMNWESSEAINYYQKVDSVLTENNIINLTLYKSNVNIGKLIHRNMPDSLDLVKIQEYYDEALKITIVLKDTVNQAYMLTKLGDLYESKQEYNRAIIQHKKAEKLIKEDDINSLSNLYWALASVYLAKKDYVNGKKYTYKRYNLIKNSGNLNEKAYANWVHASLLFMAKDYKNAIKYNKLSISLYDNLDYKDYGRMAGAASNVYTSYQELGDYKSALEYLEMAMIYQDSVLTKAKNNKVKELEAKYQTAKKEQEIALLKSQNEIVEQQKRNQRNLLLGGIGVTTIVGLFLYFLYRNRQKTNKKLKELDTLKSNFFANISHEFRTPLTLIASPIDDILENETISDKKRQQFTVAKQNSQRLLELVNQLLDLSKIDAGHLKLHIQQGDLLQLISSLTESFDYYANQKNIKYTITVEQNEELVWFDKDAIEKITVNLLSNAIKYTPENGMVSCHAFIKSHRLFLDVKNSGKGLTDYQSQHIFQRFYQTNNQNQGTGIGLALVKELVELHKGKIEVSSSPDIETSFKLNLSVDKNSFKNETIIATSNSEIQTEIPQYKSSIVDDDDDLTDSDLPILLLVEDNDDLRNLLKQTFEDTYTIITASNGVIGVKQALEHIPDLIISDIMMPEKDGITLTKELKNDERSAHIPIILLTAKAEVESHFKGIETGADDYITKPFDKKLLALKVEKLIESRRQLQLRYSQELILMPKDIAITNLDEKFLEKVQTILEKNLVESSFSVTDFSEAVGMSRMQLHRKLKALTGLTASEFIRSQRLKLATQLLKTSDINISQVGYSVGFNDHSYFTKCFKKAYDCTPTEFAKRS